MHEDPVVAETRELREQMMEDAGNDLDALFEYLKKEQQAYQDRLVCLPPRKAIPVATARRRAD
jgi:pyrroloquinoline quinone (PQQ) biosynthesis protein C